MGEIASAIADELLVRARSGVRVNRGWTLPRGAGAREAGSGECHLYARVALFPAQSLASGRRSMLAFALSRLALLLEGCGTTPPNQKVGA